MSISEIEDRLIELHPDYEGNNSLEVYAAYAYLNSSDVEDLDSWSSDADECYQGEFRSDSDFAQEIASELSLIDETLTWPYTCIDWEQAASELMMDYSEAWSHYFRSM